jgi:hypothetical protein
MIKIAVIVLLTSIISLGAGRSDTFIVSMLDRKVHVISPDKVQGTFTVIVENKSLSKLVGKFSTPEGALKYVSVESGATETVEITHKSGSKVFFVPLSPAFQEIELIVGKKEYEIPSEK